MKILLDIKDSKVSFILELLKNFKFVKIEPMTPYKADVLKEIKDSIEEYNLVKEGKVKARDAKNLLDEL